MEKARLRPGPRFQPDRAILYYLQRVAVEPHIRRTISAAIAFAVRTRRCSERNYRAIPPQYEEILRTLRKSGLGAVGSVLGEAEIHDILQFIGDKPLRNVLDPRQAFPDARSMDGVAIAEYDPADLVHCPHLLELANSEWLLALAEDYLGCPPTLSGMTLRWSLPMDGAPVGPQAFHRDFADWRCISLFIYLTPVGEGNGPHVYIPNSHRSLFAHGLRGRRRNGEPANAPQVVTGPAGFGFVADKFGVHRAAPPRTGPRLMLEITYSVLPNYAYIYRRWRHSPELGRYANRLFVDAA